MELKGSGITRPIALPLHETKPSMWTARLSMATPMYAALLMFRILPQQAFSSAVESGGLLMLH